MLPKRLSPAVKTFRQQKVAETSSAILLPKRPEPKIIVEIEYVAFFDRTIKVELLFKIEFSRKN